MGHPLIYFLFVSIQCLESFTRISDGSLSDIIIPSEEKNIKIEECQDKIEIETENSQGDENFIKNNLEEPGTVPNDSYIHPKCHAFLLY